MRRRPRGFTLLEVMVVMVIVAILAALVVPNLFAGSNRGKDLEREAATLAARIRLAQDEAMLTGSEFGVVFSREGYRFVRWDPAVGRFRALPPGDGEGWTVRELAAGLGMSADPEGSEPILVVPEPPEPEEGAAAEAAGAAPPEPQEPLWEPSVFVLSSGEVTPFTAVFSVDDDADAPAVELRIDPLGNRLAPPGAPAGEAADATP